MFEFFIKSDQSVSCFHLTYDCLPFIFEEFHFHHNNLGIYLFFSFEGESFYLCQKLNNLRLVSSFIQLTFINQWLRFLPRDSFQCKFLFSKRVQLIFPFDKKLQIRIDFLYYLILISKQSFNAGTNQQFVDCFILQKGMVGYFIFDSQHFHSSLELF